MDEHHKRSTFVLCAQASPEVLARVQELRAQGDHAKADYWLAKALRLNTQRGIRRSREMVAALATRQADTEIGNGTESAT